MAAEETVVFFTGNFLHFRAYRVDSNTMRHIDYRTEHKIIEYTIGSRCAGTAGDRVRFPSMTGYVN